MCHVFTVISTSLRYAYSAAWKVFDGKKEKKNGDGRGRGDVYAAFTCEIVIRGVCYLTSRAHSSAYSYVHDTRTCIRLHATRHVTRDAMVRSGRETASRRAWTRLSHSYLPSPLLVVKKKKNWKRKGKVEEDIFWTRDEVRVWHVTSLITVVVTINIGITADTIIDMNYCLWISELVHSDCKTRRGTVCATVHLIFLR